MGKGKGKKMATQIAQALRQSVRKDYVDSLRDGKRQRSNVFKPKRGPGSYSRKSKHGGYDG
jgi:hypothetical protein